MECCKDEQDLFSMFKVCESLDNRKRDRNRLFITQQVKSALKLVRTSLALKLVRNSLLGSFTWIASITVQTQIFKWASDKEKDLEMKNYRLKSVEIERRINHIFISIAL